jgi:hypothetical protein
LLLVAVAVLQSVDGDTPVGDHQCYHHGQGASRSDARTSSEKNMMPQLHIFFSTIVLRFCYYYSTV